MAAPQLAPRDFACADPSSSPRRVVRDEEPAPRSQDDIPTVPPPRSSADAARGAQEEEERALGHIGVASREESQRISGVYAALREEVWLQDGDPRRE